MKKQKKETDKMNLYMFSLTRRSGQTILVIAAQNKKQAEEFLKETRSNWHEWHFYKKAILANRKKPVAVIIFDC